MSSIQKAFSVLWKIKEIIQFHRTLTVAPNLVVAVPLTHDGINTGLGWCFICYVVQNVMEHQRYTQ